MVNKIDGFLKRTVISESDSCLGTYLREDQERSEGHENYSVGLQKLYNINLKMYIMDIFVDQILSNSFILGFCFDYQKLLLYLFLMFILL